MRFDFGVSLLTKSARKVGRQAQTFSTLPACQSCHFETGVGSIIAGKDE
jgi:cytochrome c553